VIIRCLDDVVLKFPDQPSDSATSGDNLCHTGGSVSSRCFMIQRSLRLLSRRWSLPKLLCWRYRQNCNGI